jgi:hypothetical protein
MPIQGTKRATGMSVLSDQERTKSTIRSRVSWGTQQWVRVPQDFFLLRERFHELGHDLVFACEFGFELLDLGVLGIFEGLGLAAVGEGEVAILEEFLEPVVDLVRMQIEFIAEIGNSNLVDKVAFEDGDFLVIGKMTTRFVHVKPPYRLC